MIFLLCSLWESYDDPCACCRVGSTNVRVVLVGLLACAVPALCIQNAVVEWQDTLEQVVRDYNISNQLSARYFALSNLAQYQVWPSSPNFTAYVARRYAVYTETACYQGFVNDTDPLQGQAPDQPYVAGSDVKIPFFSLSDVSKDKARE